MIGTMTKSLVPLYVCMCVAIHCPHVHHASVTVVDKGQ